MSENKIKVTATTSTKPVRVSVSTPASQGNVTFSQDTSAYNANLAQQWAVSENLVLGQDYSSKYYANKAKESATNANNTFDSIRDTYQDFQEESNNAFNELNVSKAEVLGEIDIAKTNAVDSINTTKTTIITDIEFVADGEKKEIEDLIDTGKDEIQELTNEIKDNAEDIINRVGLNMFDTVLKDHVLTYEESKGLALQGTWVYKTAIAGERYGYPDFYEKCLEEKNAGTATEVTLAGTTITMYIYSNGHAYYDIADKSVIDTCFSVLGMAWWYGIDTENERVFLPRNNWFEQATVDIPEINAHVEAGLPNITGTITNMYGGGYFASEGVFETIIDENFGRGSSSGGSRGGSTNFNASRSSSIYGNSDTVQPNAVKKLLYICVGNTVSDTSWVDVVTQVEGGVKDIQVAEQEAIERLKATSNALNTTQITNCLLEVPQNIKLVLNDGVLTLKASSKVIVPNGAGIYNELVVSVDKTATQTQNENRMYFYNGAYIEKFPISQCYSGSTAPTGQTYMFWYDTTNNLVKKTSDGGANWETGWSLPFAICTATNGAISSINQVFNGMGYIGSTIWVDKGIKCLIPNGRNKDGTLNNMEHTTSKVGILNAGTSNTQFYVVIDTSKGEGVFLPNYSTIGKTRYYDSETNYWYVSATNGTGGKKAQWCMLSGAIITADNNIISSAKFNSPFRAVDYNIASGLGMPSNKYIDLTLGASGTTYTAPANGWIYVNKKAASQGQYLNIVNENNSLSNVGLGLGSSSTLAVSLPILKGHKYSVNYSATGATNVFRFIYAEGEV